MAQKSRFFDSSAGDRVYTSAAIADVLAAIVEDGVVSTGNEMAVSENSPTGMSVRVNTGKAWVQGYYLEVYTAQEVLTIAAAHATLGRIDRVVVRRDLTNRTAVLAVITGTPAASPAAPALTQNPTGTWEIPLAQVSVGAAVVTIVNANITDERGARVKGLGLIAELLAASGHRHEGTNGTGRAVRHTDLGSVTSDQHHNKAHGHTGGDGSGTVAHSATTGIGADDHHARSHNHANASDGVDLVPQTLDVTKTLSLSGIISPTVGSSQNNWNPTGLATADVIRLNANSVFNITGIAAPSGPRVIFLVNVAATGSALVATLKNESASSSAPNQIIGPNGADVVLNPGQGVTLWYDTSDNRWRVISKS